MRGCRSSSTCAPSTGRTPRRWPPARSRWAGPVPGSLAAVAEPPPSTSPQWRPWSGARTWEPRVPRRNHGTHGAAGPDADAAARPDTPANARTGGDALAGAYVRADASSDGDPSSHTDASDTLAGRPQDREIRRIRPGSPSRRTIRPPAAVTSDPAPPHEYEHAEAAEAPRRPDLRPGADHR